jgi:hypothetical protein
MTIDNQLILFFLKIGEPDQDNSRFTPEQALIYLNSGRQKLAEDSQFFTVQDTMVAADVSEGDYAFPIRSDMIGIHDFKGAVLYDQLPVLMVSMSEFDSAKNNKKILPAEYVRWGCLINNELNIFPDAEASKQIDIWGWGLPTELGATSGPDVYLNNQEARASVYAAAAMAKDDMSAQSVVLWGLYKDSMVAIKKTKRMQGPRLDTPPDE